MPVYSATEDIYHWCKSESNGYPNLNMTDNTMVQFRQQEIEENSKDLVYTIAEEDRDYDMNANESVDNCVNGFKEDINDNKIITNLCNELNANCLNDNSRPFPEAEQLVIPEETASYCRSVSNESNKKERFSFAKLRNTFLHKDSHRSRDAPPLRPTINNGSMSGSDEKPKLMTRKQLLYPFDSDSEEEIELTAAHNTNHNKSLNPSHASTTQTDSDQPSHRSEWSAVRQPIQNQIQSTNMRPSAPPTPSPTSSLSPSLSSRRLAPYYSITGGSMQSGLYRMAQPVELAPGLLDISPGLGFRLQRAYSAPTGHSFLVDPRRRTLSREEQLRERARNLLESVRNNSLANNNIQNLKEKLTKQEEERQRQLRESARRLIAEARRGVTNAIPVSGRESLRRGETTFNDNIPLNLNLNSTLSYNNRDTNHNFLKSDNHFIDNDLNTSNININILRRR